MLRTKISQTLVFLSQTEHMGLRRFSSGTGTRVTTRTCEISNVVVVDAVRTPFAVSNTVFKDLMAVDLQRHALKGSL